MSRELSPSDIQAELDVLTLQRIHYFATRPVDELATAQNRRLPENTRARMIADMHGRLMMQMTAFIYAERVQREEVTVIVEQPADWIEHLKAQIRRWALDHSPRWVPLWLMRRLRELHVRSYDLRTKVRFEHFIKYPDFMPPADLEARGRRLGIGIPEVRVDGSWKRAERVPGWWKE